MLTRPMRLAWPYKYFAFDVPRQHSVLLVPAQGSPFHVGQLQAPTLKIRESENMGIKSHA